jgi:hypothetical protein
VTSGAQLSELQRALGYECLRNQISPEQARDFRENIEAAAIMVASVGHVAFSSDAGDNIILATAIETIKKLGVTLLVGPPRPADSDTSVGMPP